MRRIIQALVGALIAVFAGVFVYGGDWRGILSTATAATWPENDGSDFPAARRQFRTALSFPTDDTSPVAPPPPKIFRVVNYRSAVGPLPAYLTPTQRTERSIRQSSGSRAAIAIRSARCGCRPIPGTIRRRRLSVRRDWS